MPRLFRCRPTKYEVSPFLRGCPSRARDRRAGGLELDHLRAEIGKHGRAERARERVSEVEDFDVFEGWQFHDGMTDG